jgi:ribose/xylose/arabinose/galactoside ABC-type transport system permease subunit
MSGVCAAISGVVLAGFSGSGIAYAATGMELQIIAAVILGGTALIGGRGTIFGTFLGVLFLGVVLNGMTLIGMSSYWQLIVMGSALLIAVAIDDSRKTKGLA